MKINKISKNKGKSHKYEIDKIANYNKILHEIDSVSDVSIVKLAELNKWGEYEFKFDGVQFTLRTLSTPMFNVFTITNVFNYEGFEDKLKGNFDDLIEHFNKASVGFKAARLDKESHIVVFSCELLYANGVVNADNIKVNAMLLSSLPKNLLNLEA